MDLGRGFRGDNASISASDILLGLVVVLGAAAFFWLLHYLRNRQDHTQVINNPRKLFAAICKLHRLGVVERALLQKTASANGIKHPGQLFVSPDLLLAQAEKASGRKRAQLKALCDKLFGPLGATG